ncbi:SUMF1/EgtB/PvdO family nonheme iron enzyme [Bradyrhizobium uaiense]|nr:SUMF1/EgtB/PvdO family nonheme iron enzyme [Bradyrhizobium uaiense]
MHRLRRLVAVLFGLLALSVAPAEAKRVALVVGINSYDNLKSDQQLHKAVNDARAVAATLKDVGFQVVQAENATRSDFLRTWQRFLDSVQPGDVTTIYFAGHGIELNGVNFILTRDVPRPDDGEELMRGNAIRVGSLMERLREQNPQVAIWIIDACRDSPFAGPGVTRGVGSTRGLKREDPPKGTLVMMSAGSGQGALDALSDADANPNSVYTRTLLPLLKEPGLEVTDLAKRLRTDVEALASTIGRDQRPAFYHELSGDFFLVPPSGPRPSVSAPSSGVSEAAAAWASVKDTSDRNLLEAFVRQFPGTFYAGLAQARLDTAAKPQAVATVIASLPAASAAAPTAILVPQPPAAISPALVPSRRKPPSAMESAQAWIEAKDSNDVTALERFISVHGESIYAAPARERLEAARRRQAAATPQGPASPASPARPSNAAEVAKAWVAVKDATEPQMLEAFLQLYGDSIYAAQARQRIADLHDSTERMQVAALPVQFPIAPFALKPGGAFRDCARCPEMVVVPAGSFTMGSPKSEAGRASNEGTERSVSIKAFAVGKFAVTFDEWDACVAAGGCDGYRPADQNGRRGRYPVVNVSWKDAKRYVAWLARTTGKPYRLLSEAEREYVARGGTTTPFWFGASITPRQANYNGSIQYANGEKGEFRNRSLPVDFFAANPFGLYQVHGNVYEWTEDCWRPSDAGSPSDGSARMEADCAAHALRGGSLRDGPDALRSAARSGFATENRTENVGFRIARGL